MTQAQNRQPSGTVLVVDDHAAARESIADVLRHAGYHVVSLSSPMEALPRLQQEAFELVITDLSGMDPVKVLSSQRIHDVQKQMGMKDKAVDKDRTTEVAIRAAFNSGRGTSHRPAPGRRRPSPATTSIPA